MDKRPGNRRELSHRRVLIVEVLNTAERKCQRPCQSAEGLGFCMNGYSVFLVGFVLQQLVVEFVKNQLGSLRPNFFDVCRPQFNQSFCPGYVSKYTCSGSEHGPDEIRESRLSFPSGHASFSMYIAIYFCFYIQRRLHVTFSRIVKLFLQFGLVFLAVVCGLSRIQDNKHHPADVIVGFFVGLTTAFHFVGDKILPVRDDSESLSFQLTDEKRCCCSCGATTPTIAELQSPAPLLPNEYLSDMSHVNGSVHKYTCSFKLNEKPTVRHHKSTPITPSRRVEDV
ncbi:PLPP1-like protein [Mya arenaria]|uniref:PLPP1-like protein n=1 Tax=Mya arenaria TaxID=6604 RepID=A0ABY7FNL0_MYAAR|nr:PLPP1-like protein [Mya arenaria]